MRYVDRDGQAAEVQGSRTKIAGTLVEADYQAVMVEHTAGGREIRVEADGLFHVQAHNDNYWLTAATLDDARDAYWHPELYR